MNKEQTQKLEQAIRAVKSGDQSRYCDVVDAMLPAVRTFVVARSLPGMDVDEIVQKVFIAAYKELGDYRASSDFRAWIVTLARYETMTEATRLRRQLDYHTRYIPVAIATQMEKRIVNEQSEDERLLLLRSCLEQISEKGKELLRRRYEDDLAMTEIADRVNRTAGAVRKELCLLRKRLHECIKQKLAVVDGSEGGEL